MTLYISGIDSYDPCPAGIAFQTTLRTFGLGASILLASGITSTIHHAMGIILAILSAFGIERDPLELWHLLNLPSYFRRRLNPTWILMALIPTIKESKLTLTKRFFAEQLLSTVWGTLLRRLQNH